MSGLKKTQNTDTKSKRKPQYVGGSCKTWMLDGWTILTKNLDNSVKNDAFSGLFFELNGLHSVKPGLEKPGLRNHGRHFGRPLQSMVA